MKIQFDKKRPLTIMVSLIVLTALTVIPLIYSTTMTAAYEDPINRLNRVPTAIINEDEPVTINGRHFAIGDELTKMLLTSSNEKNFKWKVMDREGAAKDLKDQRLYATLLIPKHFSADIASLSGGAKQAKHAELKFTSNDSTNYIVGLIGGMVADKLSGILSQKVSQKYLENVYLSFGDIHTQLSKAADGAGKVGAGVGVAKAGTDQLSVGIGQLAGGAGRLSGGAGELASGLQKAHTGSSELSTGITQLHNGATQLSGGLNTFAAESGKLSGGIAQIDDGLGKALDGSKQLQDGATKINQGVQPLNDRIQKLRTLRPWIEDIIGKSDLTDSQKERIKKSLEPVFSQAEGNLDKAQQLADGTAQMEKGLTQLVGDNSTGLTALKNGTATLRAKTTDLPANAHRLADGATQLTGGLGKAEEGASALNNGIGSAATGARQLADGAGKLANGANQAHAGASQLAGGLGKLQEGSTALHAGLNAGTKKVPAFTPTTAKQLSNQSASPVRLKDERLHAVNTFGEGITPFFMALSLWVGAIAIYMIMSPVSKKWLYSRRSTLRVGLSSFGIAALIGIAQAIGLTIAAPVLNSIFPKEPLQMLVVTIMASVTFVAINQMFVSLFGSPGRFVALLLIVVQLASSGGTYPIETTPPFFRAVHHLLPMTHVVEGLRATTSGGPVAWGSLCLTLGLWLVVSVVGTITAVSVFRRKGTTPDMPADPVVARARLRAYSH
ncbi:MAG: YhgE/Pip domain-containing protein [Actinomycetaceae bacterium]|nr:YhgE/Pip domain-containing protein [Actinomycetaceae bacterium]